jgi:hypothetical protein
MNPAVDMSWITDPIDQLTSQYSGLFLQYGNDLLWTLASVILIWYALKHGISGGLILFLMEYALTVLIAANILHYYSAPLPGVGLSFHQLFPAMAQELANNIDMKRLDVFFGKVGAVLLGTHPPAQWDFAMYPVYWVVEFLMWIVQAALYGATGIGFIALGVGNLVGPLFVPFLIVPVLSHLFWNWLQFIWQYSFYRVAAAAVLFVISTALNNFLDNTVQGDYSLSNWLILMPKMIVLVGVSLWAVLRVTAFVSDLFKGTSSSGSNVLASLASGRLY